MLIQNLTKNKLYLQNNEIIDVSPDIIHEYGLKIGKDISNIYIDVLKASIKHKALFYIYLKARTKYELICKLKAKYKQVEYIEEVVEELEKLGYIDDVDYALSYIMTHSNSKQKNIFKLMQKGISRSSIEKAYEDAPNEIEDDLLEKEIKKLQNKNLELAQIIVKLTRKGYAYSKIKKIIEIIK